MSNGKPFGRVIWHDAHSSSDQYSELEIDHIPATVETYGFIVRSNEIGVSIAAEWMGDGFRNITFIPRGMVVREEVLKLAKTRKKPDAPPPTS